MASKKISQLTSGSVPSLTGVTAISYSGTTFQHTLSSLRQTLVDSGSHYFTGSQVINGNLTVSGSLTAQQYILSSSITNITLESISGSSVFGNDLNDIHSLSGSVRITGSLGVSGSARLENLFIGSGSFHSDNPEILSVHNSGSFNIAHFEGNNNVYSQVNITNTNSGNNASTDLVLTADNGTENVHYVDLGINSSTYTGGLVGYANDSYLLNVGKDMYIGTVGGTSHPAKLKLFANNNWENSQITVHTGSQVTFNTGSFTTGYTYEFSGSLKLKNELKVDGSVTSSYFVGDGSQLSNLPIPTYISSGPTAPGSSVIANNTSVSVNFAMAGTKHSFTQTGMTTNGFTILSQVTSSFVNDAAAAAAGVPLQGLYRSGSFVMIRLT